MVKPRVHRVGQRRDEQRFASDGVDHVKNQYVTVAEYSGTTTASSMVGVVLVPPRGKSLDDTRSIY
ncbi:hypothetical protein [Mycobacteroides abscessus]